MSDVNMKIDNARDIIMGNIVILTPPSTTNKTTRATEGQITLTQTDIVNKRRLLGDRFDDPTFYSA